MKSSKKVMSIVLALTMIMAIISSCAIVASAEGLTVTIGAATVEAGETEVKVPVTVSGNSGIWGALVNIVVPEGLTYKALENGDMFQKTETLWAPDEVVNRTGVATFTAQFSDLATNNTNNGTLFYAVFTVDDAAAVGTTYEIKFGEKKSADFIDCDANDIVATYAEGNVTVVEPVEEPTTTEAPATEAPATEAPATEAPATTDKTEDKNPGTGAAAAPIAAMALVAAAAVVIAKSKKA